MDAEVVAKSVHGDLRTIVLEEHRCGDTGFALALKLRRTETNRLNHGNVGEGNEVAMTAGTAISSRGLCDNRR